MEIEVALRQQVAKAVGKQAAGGKLEKLPGHASNRSYYRMGEYPNSVLLMVMPPHASKQSEEASREEPAAELPFLNIQRYLKGLEVRVPQILQYDEAAAVLVMEDLGNLTFETALGRTESAETLYPKAIDLLAHLRAASERNPDPNCLAFTRSFDQELYDWELHHFREFGMEAWSGKRPSQSERAELDQIFRRLSNLLSLEPKGFTHRDYQSRNIMIKDGELVVIDFQDALLGPRQYDLVALLRDSYVELEWSFVDRMLDRYLAAFERESGEKIPPQPFKAFFDLLTIQRKLKDAARFEYIYRVKGNPSFLPSIPASLRYASLALQRRLDFSDLQDIAARYVPALAR